MELMMDRQKLLAMAKELAKDIKSEAVLNALSKELLKLTVETALNAELTEHLGYEKHGDSKPARGNARNGSTSKKLKGQHGEVEILTPVIGRVVLNPNWYVRTKLV